MKILVVSHMYPTSFNEVYGVFVHEQVKELIRQGHEVKVVAPIRYAPYPINKMSKKWEMYSKSPKISKVEGVEVYHPRYVSFPKAVLFNWTGNFMYYGIYALIKEIEANFKFDLIHTHVALPDGFATKLIVERLNKPFVLTIHGQDFYSSINKSNKIKDAVHVAIKSADKVILVSNKLLEIGERNFPESCFKYNVIPNGVNPIFLNERKDFKRQYFNNSGPKILSVSNLIERKGIEYNIRAISKIIDKYPNLKYIVAGAGEERERLERLTYDLNLEKYVEFVGSKNQIQVKQLMDECDVFSMPSWNEAFGVVYIEAMACSKTVIGCIGEGIEDIVENGRDGFLVPPKDEATLAQIFDKVFVNEDIREKVALEAKRKVENKFTWEKNVKRIIEVYKSIT